MFFICTENTYKPFSFFAYVFACCTGSLCAGRSGRSACPYISEAAPLFMQQFCSTHNPAILFLQTYYFLYLTKVGGCLHGFQYTICSAITNTPFASESSFAVRSDTAANAGSASPEPVLSRIPETLSERSPTTVCGCRVLCPIRHRRPIVYTHQNRLVFEYTAKSLPDREEQTDLKLWNLSSFDVRQRVPHSGSCAPERFRALCAST